MVLPELTVEVISPLVVFILEKDNLAAIFSSFVFDELLEIKEFNSVTFIPLFASLHAAQLDGVL